MEAKSKACRKCGEVKPLTEYHKHKKMADGHLHACKVCQNKASAKHRAENPDYMKRWHAENKDQQKAYYEERKDYFREKQNTYVKTRRGKDLAYKLRGNLRNRLNSAIKVVKSSSSILNLLDCSVQDLVLHLEANFQEGMSWDNHGNRAGQWSIDHVIPLSMFEDPEDKRAWVRRNLMPVWATDNVSKGGANRAIMRNLDKIPSDLHFPY